MNNKEAKVPSQVSKPFLRQAMLAFTNICALALWK